MIPSLKIRLPNRKRPGVSALIAMIMVMAFMFTMSSVMVAMSRSLKIAQGGAAADQAYLNAVTGLELGLYRQNKGETQFTELASAITGTTYTSGPITIGNTKSANNSTNQTGNTINFKITDTLSNGGKVCGDEASTTEESCNSSTKKFYYSYPFPGSGSLGGNGCNAATQPTVKDEQWYRDMYFFVTGKEYSGTDQLSKPSSPNSTSTYDTKKDKQDWSVSEVLAYINSGKFTTLDHPCLWNKLEPGVSAEIPLYNSFIDSPKNISELWLRVRMPCNSGTVCRDDNGERMKVVIPTDPKEQSKRAILWDIIADCSNSPVDQVVCFIKEVTGDNLKGKQLQQSVIQKQFMNEGNSLQGAYNSNPFKNIVLSLGYNTLDASCNAGGAKPLYGQTSDTSAPTKLYSTICSFMHQLGDWKDMTKPTMHLSISDNLIIDSPSINKTKAEVPYIQYQILYKTTTIEQSGDKAIITNPTVTSTGQNGGYTINLESSLTKQTGTYGYALIGK